MKILFVEGNTKEIDRVQSILPLADVVLAAKDEILGALNSFEAPELFIIPAREKELAAFWSEGILEYDNTHLIVFSNIDSLQKEIEAFLEEVPKNDDLNISLEDEEELSDSLDLSFGNLEGEDIPLSFGDDAGDVVSAVEAPDELSLAPVEENSLDLSEDDGIEWNQVEDDGLDLGGKTENM